MSAILDPAISIAPQHERRRQNPLPREDDALRIVRAEEARRAGIRVNDAFDRAVTP